MIHNVWVDEQLSSVEESLPYFQLQLVTQNENLNHFKFLCTNLAGKLNCIVKMHRIERLQQLCFSGSHCVKMKDLEDYDKILANIKKSNAQFDEFVGSSLGAGYKNLLRFHTGQTVDIDRTDYSIESSNF